MITYYRAHLLEMVQLWFKMYSISRYVSGFGPSDTIISVNIGRYSPIYGCIAEPISLPIPQFKTLGTTQLSFVLHGSTEHGL